MEGTSEKNQHLPSHIIYNRNDLIKFHYYFFSSKETSFGKISKLCFLNAYLLLILNPYTTFFFKILVFKRYGRNLKKIEIGS